MKTISVPGKKTSIAVRLNPAKYAGGCDVKVEGLFIVDPVTGDKLGTSITIEVPYGVCLTGGV